MTLLLFHGEYVTDVLVRCRQNCMERIDSLGEARVLQTPQDDLILFFTEEYAIQAPKIDESEIQTNYDDIRVDVTHNMCYKNPGINHVPGTRITYHVPFTGAATLLACRPSQYDDNPPCATVEGQELLFIYDRIDPEKENINS